VFVCVRNCVFIVSSRYYIVMMILLVEVQLAWTSLLCCDMLHCHVVKSVSLLCDTMLIFCLQFSTC